MLVKRIIIAFFFVLFFIIEILFIYGSVSEKMTHRYIYIKVIKIIHVGIAITSER